MCFKQDALDSIAYILIFGNFYVKIKEKIFQEINENSTVFDALKLASSYYTYVYYCIQDNIKEITEEEIEQLIKMAPCKVIGITGSDGKTTTTTLISEILKNKSTISFEVFPPKNKEGDISSIYSTIEGLAKLSPDFISVTYGAGGSTKGKTVEIASVIKHEYGIESVAHLSCISSTKEDIKYECERLKEAGIDNILALRGDYPADATNFDPENLEFHYASELNEFIGEHFKGQFCLSGACYPETHQEADGFKKDLEALKKKVDAGAEYLVTQIFFDNDYYYRLVREARKIGITVPILAGIMPITNAKSLIRTTKMCGCTIPYQLSTMIEAHYDNPEAMKEIGINYAAQQIIDLITNGVDGIHIYTMNRAETAQRVFDSIPAVLKELN